LPVVSSKFFSSRICVAEKSNFRALLCATLRAYALRERAGFVGSSR
jgi:hypothetical protein